MTDTWTLPSNRPPRVTAAVSPAAPIPGQAVTLAAAFTDPDGDTPTWRWMQTYGPSVALQNATSAVATFATSIATSYGFEVVAGDGHEGHAYALGDVTVSTTAVAGLTYLSTNEKGYREFRNDKDGSVLIEVPAQGVTPTFFIGKYEVTNAQYRAFLAATSDPKGPTQHAGHDLAEGAGYDHTPGGGSGVDWPPYSVGADHPPAGVSWYDAYAYCVWAGLELPTEALWQYAAQGPDGRMYPWGNQAPDAGGVYRANYYVGSNGTADGYQYTSPVGSYGPGATPPPADGSAPSGALDIDGNVMEWTNDWWSGTGPDRVFRGGGWSGTYEYLQAAYRYSYQFPTFRSYGIGFRVSLSLQALVNSSPVGITALASSPRVLPATPVALTGTATDPDGDPLTYAWAFTSQPSGGNGNITNPSTATPTFSATRSGTYVLGLTVSDGRGGSGTASVSVVVNTPPTVNAGADVSTLSGASVTLTAIATDADGDPLGYSWLQTSGPAISLPNPNVRAITFTLPAIGAYGFTVTASDPNGGTAQDSVSITATAPPRPDLEVLSVATGATRIELGQSLPIAGSVRNSSAVTSPACQATFQLSLDATIQSGDPLLGTVNVPGRAPNVTQTISTTFAIPGSVAAGSYFLGLTADSAGAVAESNETNNVKVTALPITITQPAARLPNLVARAVAGPSTVRAGDTFTGAASVENAGTADVTSTFALAYYLSRDAVHDAGDTLAGTESLPSLAAGARSDRSPSLGVPAGTAAAPYYLLLRVDPSNAIPESSEADNAVPSALTVQVTTRPVDTTPPTATLAYGPGATVTTTGTLTITASFSEALAGPPTIQLCSGSGQLLGGTMSAAGGPAVYTFLQTFTATSNGTYTVSLRGADVAGNPLVTQPGNNSVTVAIVSNRPPVADAGPGVTVAPATLVRLQGSGTDPDGDTLTYRWIAPGGVTLSDPTSPTPTFTPATAGTYHFVLRVTDLHGADSEDTVDIVAGQVTAGLRTDLLVVRGVVRLESGEFPPAGSRLRVL
ncbi:MAG: SUMF1/EgtB/PvdO family nonheme iron enzyme, partial [Candidatus Riflebacteria bacterium]|nr:SUMF1/EgtB/PvdO family nonheme iron enzyme [Candidatus Riflebacteria bacterium]